MQKDNKELLWLAIVALTEQLLLGKIENAQYTIEMGIKHSIMTKAPCFLNCNYRKSEISL